MPAFVTFGRVLFAVLFLYSGATKLMDIGAAVKAMPATLVVPAFLTPYVSTFLDSYAVQLKSLTGMTPPESFIVAVGVFEIVAGLMIALNFGARFFAILLIIFVGLVTFYYHDFWNQTGSEAGNNLIHALKNLSIIGALFIIAGYGRSARAGLEPAYGD